MNRTPRPAVLLVEDDGAIAQFVAASLGAAGLDVRRAGDLAGARAELAAAGTDLLVLDLGLPDGDGVDLVRTLRAAGNLVPLLVLSARSAEAQKIEALDAGADDFLVKPFGAGELVARARAMLRRGAAAPAPPPRLQVGELDWDSATGTLCLRGERVHLSRREAALFAALARRPGQVLTHRQLLAQVWGADQVDQLHYLRVYMGHLRAKLEADPAEPRYLLTELGVGYRLADD